MGVPRVNASAILAVALCFYYITLYSFIDVSAYAVLILALLIVFPNSPRFKFTLPVIAVVLFCLFVLLSAVFSIDFSRSLPSAVYVASVYIFSVLLSFYVNNYKDMERVLYFVVLGFLVLAIRSFFEGGTGILRAEGVTGQPNALGLVSATGAVCAFSYLYIYNDNERKSIKLCLVLACGFLSAFWVFMSASRGAIVSLIIALLYLYGINKKSFFKFFVGGVLLSLFLYFSFYEQIAESSAFQRLMLLPSAIGIETGYASNNDAYKTAADSIRLRLAETAISGFIDKPVFGNGPNTFIHVSDFVYTHNTFLELLYSFGASGFGAFTLFLLSLIWVSRKQGEVPSEHKNLLKVRNFLLIYFVLAGVSIPNFQNKSQIIIITLLLALSRGHTFYQNREKQLPNTRDSFL